MLEATCIYVRYTYLFLPATMIRRSGQKLDSAVAVDPPTRPVPPRTNTFELRILSGSSGRLVAEAVTLKFKLRGNEIGAIDWFGLMRLVSFSSFLSVALCLIAKKILILFLSLLLPRSFMHNVTLKHSF